jgi:hypothetical protein
MPKHSTYHDRSRYDSALDLSRNGGQTPHEDFEDTQTVAASSVMGPWSQYNTRVCTVNSFFLKKFSLAYVDTACIGSSVVLCAIVLSPSTTRL